MTEHQHKILLDTILDIQYREEKGEDIALALAELYQLAGSLDFPDEEFDLVFEKSEALRGLHT
ncbi:hypothetical protein [uncultured Cohaesibacter sp.]|uniref:hypothetical protein n=1 Tax=uncultured Cohaesibacter sp. TaxID=1002546 RepID=UPI00292D35CD|nr:hypothetical protein [uncultured Cohaesibacter sp.]